jgi:antirestriction protein ArdC
MLWMAAQANGYPTHNWLTFKQALELGGSVRKGEKGTAIFYLSRGTKKDDNGEDKSYSFAKGYTVFNVAQCDGLPETLFEAPKPVNTDERDELADAFFTATGAEIIDGGEAYYLPSEDKVVMPAIEAFPSKDHYYATKAHETCGHWTGAKHRLNRTLSTVFGSVDYAREELVAELTSAFFCAEFGFDSDLRHAGYIEHWIKLLKEDSRAFINAASLAQKAMDYVRYLALREDAPDDEEVLAA